MRSLNRVQLIGNLGKDAETKYTQAGKAYTRFSVATEQSWKDRNTGEWKSNTDWHNVTLWDRETLAQYLTKGQKVYVEGRLQNRSYEDRDGNKKYVTDIIGENVILLGGKQGGGEYDRSGEFNQEVRSMPRSATTASAPSEYAPMPDDEDVPF